jgi:uncharacterized protein (TIGR02145 family)
MKNLALMWVLAACLLGCGGWKPSDTTFTDKRDGKVYKIVKIGSQTWFAENLNYAAEGSKCYDNKDANCAKYGRLYNWETALMACPVGTHLPTDKELTTLVDYVGDSTAGTKLKSKSGWYENGNGTDEYGFSALPGGCCDSWDGRFYGAGYFGYWWSATEFDNDYALSRSMDYDDEYVNGHDFLKRVLLSVRCVQDKRKEKRK